MALIIESFRGDGDVEEMRKRRGKREASTSTALRGRHACSSDGRDICEH